MVGIGAWQPVASQSNARTITGTVTSYEEASPLEGVTVNVKGSNKASGTQPDGVFYIEVGSKDSVLVFSYNGYQPQEVKLAGNNEYNISLHKGQAIQGNKAFSPTGKWRGVFTLNNGVEVPFNFVVKDTAGGQRLYLLNAEEKFESGIVKTTGDSLFVTLEPFENEFALAVRGDSLSGVLRKVNKTDSTPAITIHASRYKGFRFLIPSTQPAADVSGTYDITFLSPKGKDEKAVGLFTQDGNILRGTFLRITGDSRYLEGVVDGNTFYLSSFIGSVPVFYKGTITKDGKLRGAIEGPRGSQRFAGALNEGAALPDPYTLTVLKNGYSKFGFSLPAADGKPISLQDAKYRNKVVVVTITGSWCPNCIDEAAFLAPWYKANRQRGVEIISIHYERQTDSAYVQQALTRFRNRFGIEYDQVLGGIADKQQVAESLPALNTFLAFPTTIFIDRQGKVAKIHTGYSGPATGKYYDAFVKEFNEEINTLVTQK